jgi:hypothetical protein
MNRHFSAEDIWFLMHHSDDPQRQSLAVTCYCDDSGSHEESQVAVVGGVLMNKPSFLNFDRAWERMLHDFRIEGIHMRDFIRPHGRYVTMPLEMKIALFTSVAKAINKHKIYSVSVGIPQADFKSLLSMEVYRKLMGPYALAFLVTALINCGMAEALNYDNRIAYLTDKGSNHHHEQMNAAHTVLLGWEKKRGVKQSRIGPLTQDTDENNNALQGSDAIAWIYHRILESPDHESPDLAAEFAPLLDVLREQITFQSGRKAHHLKLEVPRDGIEVFANGINSWIGEKGELPSSLADMTKWKV